MANNPLQKSGPIRFRDIMLEKEWLGTESKRVSSMVEENDRLSPYLIINPYNPLSIKTNIQSKPYRVSDWYGYNHALTQDITVLDGLASFVNMKSMIKAVVESGPSKGFYANHYSVFNNLFSQAASGDADSISQSNQYLHAFNFFQVTERVTSLAGNYRITVQRAYGEISLSCISPGRQITAAEVILRGIAHTYTPCRMILVQYEQGSSWTISGWTTSMRAISEPVMFSLGDQTFKLNPLGVSLINSAIASQDKYLRFAVVTYDYDYLGEAYIGDNLLQGDDYSLETLGHWQEANTGSHLTRVLATTMNAKASSVLQLTHDAGYI
ncbi:MAG: hypothetical protein M0Q94_16615, partial [Candidatus Cloacimonetes bacterium]|nr:hypothetical protein [Candidatus Cloacimonadota bacterium]